MQRSTDRILTTHAGSLVRTREIMEAMKAAALGRPYDQQQRAADIRSGIDQVVRKQVEVGIDVPSNGEYGRQGFRSYINERLQGLALVPLDPNVDPFSLIDIPEQQAFSRLLQAVLPALWLSLDAAGSVHRRASECSGNFGWSFELSGPISYKGQAVIRQEIDDFKSALNGLDVADAFIPADVPASRYGDQRILDFYPTEAAADALREEYVAIVNAGFLLQLDLAALTPWGGMSSHAWDRMLEQRVELINYALRGIPEDRVRYHHCWGAMNHPHTMDPPLASFGGPMLNIKAQAYSIEAANPRHEHE
jgi:5-methyltetrahydropteroyltriglutamate--homocysteine methyltransferase